jgi:signal transduction histidine kinase
MRDIVWSLDPTNDSWERFSAELRRYAADLLESKQIGYVIDIPSHSPLRTLSLELRRSLWLVCKELIVNAVKHSQCTEMGIRLTIERKSLKLVIKDNGRGFDPHASPEGNGLRNVKQRVTALDGHVGLESSPGAGTVWTIDCKI